MSVFLSDYGFHFEPMSVSRLIHFLTLTRRMSVTSLFS